MTVVSAKPFFHKNKANTYLMPHCNLLDMQFFYHSFARWMAWKCLLWNKSTICSFLTQKCADVVKIHVFFFTFKQLKIRKLNFRAISGEKLGLKHCEIANGCLKYISSVVDMSSCSLKRLLSEIVFDQNLSFWVLSQFELLSFVTFWIVEFCHGLCFWNFSNFELSFVPSKVTILVFEVFNNLSFWVWVFVMNWVIEFFTILVNEFFFSTI